MNTMDEELNFINKVRNQVYELHRMVINTKSETDLFIENIKFCMNCFWIETMVDRGWAGFYKEWVARKMDNKKAIILIQKVIVPRLGDALKNVTDVKIRDFLTTLVQDVELWFVISSGYDDVSELKSTPDINARVEELEKQVQELRNQVQALTNEFSRVHLPILERDKLLQQLARCL